MTPKWLFIDTWFPFSFFFPLMVGPFYYYLHLLVLIGFYRVLWRWFSSLWLVSRRRNRELSADNIQGRVVELDNLVAYIYRPHRAALASQKGLHTHTHTEQVSPLCPTSIAVSNQRLRRKNTKCQSFMSFFFLFCFIQMNSFMSVCVCV
jgi:hypothetical protein